MRLALGLAARARGRTEPNPVVGAVVVRSGRVVGRGHHHRAGGPHAEVLALRQADGRARGATLYVSLEPCAHFGRTPPCAEAILRAGVRRVVAAMRDPNPLNRGRGLRRLKARGVHTRVGVLERQARALNEVFLTRMERQRPFVTVKVAQSLDGRIAARAGQSRWISGPAARRWARRLRSESDAVLVGVRTVLKDNPLLTARGTGRRRQPVRVVLDSSLRTPPEARLFSDSSPVWIAATRSAPRARERALRRAGAEVLRFPSEGGRVNLRALLRELAKREISRLLIEGGGEVIASALRARAVDRVAWVVAPKLLGGRQAVPSVGGEGVQHPDQAVRLRNIAVKRLGQDLLVTAEVAG